MTNTLCLYATDVDSQTEQHSEFVLSPLKSFDVNILPYSHSISQFHKPSGDYNHNIVRALWNGGNAAMSGLSHSYYYCSCKQPANNTAQTDVRAEQHVGGSLTSATYFQMEGRSIQLVRFTTARRRKMVSTESRTVF